MLGPLIREHFVSFATKRRPRVSTSHGSIYSDESVIESMERRSIRRGFFNRHVLVALLGILIVYFLLPLLTGSQLLFDSWAAPVWDLAVKTGRVVGCGSLACIPLILFLFLLYTYLLAVAIATIFREAYTRHQGR